MPPRNVQIAIILAAIGIALMAHQVGWRPGWGDPFRLPDGEIAPLTPTMVVGGSTSWSEGEHHLTEIGTFSGDGRVLMSVKYWGQSDQFELSPYDLVIGWGPLSDSRILHRLSFSHGYRFVYYQPRDWNDSEAAASVGGHLSHMHVIPATDTVRDALSEVDTDDLVHFSGKLVEVQSPGFLPWRSSLTINDNVCEVIWLEELRKVELPSK